MTAILHWMSPNTLGLGSFEKLARMFATGKATTMGFDIQVSVTLLMCPETGKPFYFKYNEEEKRLEKAYGLPEFTVPEELRPYLQQRGPWFHAYCDVIERDSGTTTDVEEFLECYPSWDDVKEGGYCDYSQEWTVKDHNAFRRLLKWCLEQDCYFTVSWSY